MNVLKSKLSGHFFRDFGVWTLNPFAALAFASEWQARDFVRRERLEDVQVVEPEPSGTLQIAP